MVGCPLAASAVLSCGTHLNRCVAFILLSDSFWTVLGAPIRLLSLFSALLRGLPLVACGWFGLQFTARADALLLDESLRVGDVSRAWLVSCGASWVPCSRSLGLGHKIRKARSDVADADAADVFTY